jgi:hypothetical protein
MTAYFFFWHCWQVAVLRHKRIRIREAGMVDTDTSEASTFWHLSPDVQQPLVGKKYGRADWGLHLIP